MAWPDHRVCAAWRAVRIFALTWLRKHARPAEVQSKPIQLSSLRRSQVASALPAVRGRREVARLSRETARQLTQIEDSALVDAAKIAAAKYVVFHGLYAVADLAEVEGRLISRTPLAERRLHFLGDAGAAKIAGIIEGL
jgi:hypothetical protein